MSTDVDTPGGDLQLLIHPDPRLHEVADPVDEVDDVVLDLVQAMKRSLAQQGGIGLAAPQMGVPKRVIVWCSGADPESLITLALVNPVIMDRSGTQVNEEGCLSVPEVFGLVERAERVTVAGLSPRTGREVSYLCSGYEAACVQHEVDHLDGVLFIERLTR